MFLMSKSVVLGYHRYILDGGEKLTANAAAAAVRWPLVLLARPSLNATDVARAVADDIAGSHILHNFEAVEVLADTADGNTLALIESRVFDKDISRVGLGGNTIVAILDGPTAEGNAIGEQSVGSVGVPCWIAIAASGIHIDVFEEDIVRAHDGHGPVYGLVFRRWLVGRSFLNIPHLGLNKSEAVEVRVVSSHHNRVRPVYERNGA